GFPAVQQIVQLLLFRARPIAKGIENAHAAVSRSFPAAADRPGAPRVAGSRPMGRGARWGSPEEARQKPGHSGGRCRLVQWVRAGDARPGQSLLRSRKIWAAFRRLATP